MKAWLRLVSIGVIGGLMASACVITSDDGDDDDGEGGEGGDESTGGRRPTGGAPTGGRVTGGTGTGGTTGGTSTGGASTGGAPTGGTINACDVDEFEPANTCEFEDSDTDPCSMCLSTSCCDEIKSCLSDEPTQNRCGYGITSDSLSEFECATQCLLDIGDIPTQDDIDDCVGSCMTCADVRTLDTASMTQCLADNCYEECLAL